MAWDGSVPEGLLLNCFVNSSAHGCRRHRSARKDPGKDAHCCQLLCAAGSGDKPPVEWDNSRHTSSLGLHGQWFEMSENQQLALPLLQQLATGCGSPDPRFIYKE